MFKKILDKEWIKNNNALAIAIFSLILTLGSYSIKLLNYIFIKGKFDLFSIDNYYIEVNENSFFFDFFINMSIFLSFLLVVFLINRLNKVSKENYNQKINERNRFILYNFFIRTKYILFYNSISILLALPVNYFLYVYLFKNYDLFLFIPASIIIYLCEYLALFVFKISFKKSTSEDSHDLVTKIVISIVLLPIIIVTIFMFGNNFAESNKKYQIVQNGHYVIIAKYNDSYILKKASIENDNLIIHNSHQKILDANNIEVITMTFDKVEIIND